jgi:hypothetical protein
VRGARSKYGARRVEIDGHTFHSKAEARRYLELKALRERGQISDLRLQPRFPIKLNGVLVCHYIADFAYIENDEKIIEDVKGFKTDVYRLKKKMMAACGFSIRET